MMPRAIDHENLLVYKKSLEFISWLNNVLKRVPKKLSVYAQLDRASTSIALNIAEGNGRFTARDRCRFLDIARGSALECAACLDILAARKILNKDEIQEGKQFLTEIISMIIGLIKSNSSDRVYDSSTQYDSQSR